MRRVAIGVTVLLIVGPVGVLGFLTAERKHVDVIVPPISDAPTPPLPTPSEAKPAPELDALFQRKDQWIGGDGVYSVALTPRRTLYLFSDTWVGKVRDGKRTDAKMVNNSVALQDGRGTDAEMTFVVRTDANGKPTAFITPADQLGWFWLQAAAVVEDRLYVFLSQFEKTGEPGAFGFRSIGWWLGTVANPHDAPTDWQVEQVRLPFSDIGPRRLISFGAAVLRDGAYLYIYGVDEDRKEFGVGKHLIVARAPTASVADFGSWRFYRDGDWQTDFRNCERLADGMANEYSVSYLPARRCFVAVYTQNGLSPRIVARTAPRPWGPWSAPTLLYECPEMALDRRVFTYAAKAHPMLAGDEELVVSYVVNAHDFWLPLADARLYWPRFVRVKVVSPR
jgi:Domain of unknown function (DUF4185)